MSRYITKYMNLKKSKQSTFWDGGSTKRLFQMSLCRLFLKKKVSVPFP